MLIEDDPFPLVVTVNIVNVDLRALLDMKKKLKEREENWDTHSHPSRKFDYLVKYSKLSSVGMPRKSIIQSG